MSTQSLGVAPSPFKILACLLTIIHFHCCCGQINDTCIDDHGGSISENNATNHSQLNLCPGTDRTISALIIEYIGANNNDSDWNLQLLDDLRLNVRNVDNETVAVSLRSDDPSRIARKMKTSMQKYLPYMLIPAFFMAGIMPWVMPGLKMIVMGVAMVNQMAFSASLFALVRSYIFDTEKQEHIIYVNHGYDKKKH